MGKYLKRFDSESDYAEYAQSENFVKPNVSLIGVVDASHGGAITINGVHYSAEYGSSYGN